ncbi:MAG: fumarylacetoacetate hydrolase family protein [Bacteroidetes bacterium]|nr:fumarylacetoacetate hydrolase family protein [Bacteroidota bacterium]
MKIICIGRNYIEHAKELHHTVPKEPVFFLKPDTSLLLRNRPFYYPDFSHEIHHEVEIVYKICKVGKNIPETFAHTYYEEIGIGIDFTARDLQNICKEKGLPWAIAKGFDNAAPLSFFTGKHEYDDPYAIDFHLEMNGEVVQRGNTKEMIFNIDTLIAYLSKFMTLKTGDLIYTGTPAGVGPVKIGDKLEAYIQNRKMLSCLIK